MTYLWPRLWRLSKLIFDVPLPVVKGVVKGVGKYTCASSQRWFKDIVKYTCDSCQRYGKGCSRASRSPRVSCDLRVSRSPRVSRNSHYSSSALRATRKFRKKPLGLKATQGWSGFCYTERKYLRYSEMCLPLRSRQLLTCMKKIRSELCVTFYFL